MSRQTAKPSRHEVTVGRLPRGGREHGDHQTVDELTEGRFTVTIMAGVCRGAEAGVGVTNLWLRDAGVAADRPLARGRPVIDLLLRPHRSERGRPTRCVFARAISTVGAA